MVNVEGIIADISRGASKFVVKSGRVASKLAPTSPPRFKTARGVNKAVLVLKTPQNKVLVAQGFKR